MDSGTQDNPYLLLAVFVFSAVMMGLTPILMAFVWTRWTGTAKPDDIKNAVYECGLETGTYQWFPLKVEYYIYGIIFLVFDVEILFFLPIASVYKNLPAGAIAGILVFIFLQNLRSFAGVEVSQMHIGAVGYRTLPNNSEQGHTAGVHASDSTPAKFCSKYWGCRARQSTTNSVAETNYHQSYGFSWAILNPTAFDFVVRRDKRPLCKS